jgi:hypothetical protein
MNHSAVQNARRQTAVGIRRIDANGVMISNTQDNNNTAVANVKKPINNTTNESLAQLDTFSYTKPINPRDIYRLDSTDKTAIIND